MENNRNNIELKDGGSSRGDNGSEEGNSSDYHGYDAMWDAMAYLLCQFADYFLKHIYRSLV